MNGIMICIISLVICLGLSLYYCFKLKEENIKLSSDNEKLIEENLKFFNSDEIIKDCECCSSEESINYKGVDTNE